jgi:hypothetical protein
MTRLRDDHGYLIDDGIDLARGEYHRERGELAQSRALLEEVFARVPRASSFRQHVFAALSETLLAQGESERAAGVARQGSALGDDPNTGLRTTTLRCERALGLAESALGDHLSAARRIEAAIEAARDLESPSVCGALHEARALVAQAAADSAAFRLHLEATQAWFAQTHNPALIARGERLAAHVRPEATQTQGPDSELPVETSDERPGQL